MSPLRVHELAKELGIPTGEVLGRLQELTDEAPKATFSSVDDRLAARLRASLAEPSSLGELELREGRGLILAAFGQARDRGSSEWRRMHAGVLKNRILGLTQREFDERKWGAWTFLGFLRIFDSLVAVDRSRTPPVVELVSADEADVANAYAAVRARAGASKRARDTAAGPAPPRGAWRIRSDLWSAVLDYARGDVWVWDGDEAVPVPTDAYDPADSRLRVPTVNEDILQEWRRAFEMAQAEEVPEAADKLRHWREEGQSSSRALNPELRARWYEALKLHVRDRLIAWFAENGLTLPDDFIETGERRAGRSPYGGRPVRTEELRQLVIRCVEAMTREELDELRLPPAALLRARER